MLRRALVRWYRKSGRDLPWRRHPTPYGVWVSEVMLQQTQVATVIPYFRRFLRAFPSLDRLASVPLERVLKVWSGMGYYRRARNLHRAAQLLRREFGGRFPSNYAQARTLPGVGDYTARAILSIAYGEPLAVMDGNVGRVVARLYRLRGTLQQPRFRRAVERRLAAMLDAESPGDFNQALMELGQTVCLPRAPRCPRCPLRARCRARIAGRPELYPAPRPRRPTELRHLAVAVVRRSGRVVLQRGLEEGLLAGLWNFPGAFGASVRQALERLEQNLASVARGKVRFEPSLGALRHRITHRDIRVCIYPARAAFPRHADGLRWFRPRELERAAVSELARKIARHIQGTPPRAPTVVTRSGLR